MYVYDSNIPDDSNLFVKVNLTKKKWEYAPMRWGGDRGFIPEIDVATFYNSIPTLGKSGYLGGEQGKHLVLIDSLGTEIYFSDSAFIVAKNQSGSEINSYNIFDPQIPGAFPIIPPTGIESRIIGFYIPRRGNERLSVQYKPGSAGSKYLTVLSEGAAINVNFQPVDTNLSQRFSVDLQNDRIGVYATSTNPHFDLEMIRRNPSWENVVRVMNSSLALGDSMDFQSLGNGETIKISNYGSSKQYDLALERASAHPDSANYAKLSFGSKEAHTLAIQSWDSLSTTRVTLSVDRGMDGTIDTVITLRTPTGVKEGENFVPKSYEMGQNYPNPFNSTTTIPYTIPQETNVVLKVYDVFGREIATVVNERRSAGTYRVQFDASHLPSGVYFYRLTAGGFSETKKMVLLK